MTIKNSNRLSYRLITLSDVDLLLEIDSDPKVMKYINGGKPTLRQEIVDTFIPRLAAYLRPEKGWGIWQIKLLDTGEYLGWILVRPMDFFSDSPQYDLLELGWRFKSHTWGNGFASEAAKHVATNLNKQQGVTRFCAIAVPDNLASIAVMKKVGMGYVKTYQHVDPLFQGEMVLYEMALPKRKRLVASS